MKERWNLLKSVIWISFSFVVEKGETNGFYEKEMIVVILWNNFLNWLIKWLYKLHGLITSNSCPEKEN